MKEYKRIVDEVCNKGRLKNSRTGITTISKSGIMFQHDMSEGFPLLTTKFVPIGLVAKELEFFIKGYTDKSWLQERNCHIWDEWCSSLANTNGTATLEEIKAIRELGPIYGWQWRRFGAGYRGFDKQPFFKNPDGVDQLAKLVETLKTDPDSRRMIVSAWNPLELHLMALEPCHYGFQVTVTDGKLDLMWNQRSVDVAVGLPFNIASYAITLLLLAKESGFEPGTLTGFFGDVHIYGNHLEKLIEQIGRIPYELPRMILTNYGSIFDWDHAEFVLKDYEHHPAIKYDIAV